MVDFQKLLDKERYLKLRYELDMILSDAIITITKGRFLTAPYERITFSIEYTDWRSAY